MKTGETIKIYRKGWHEQEVIRNEVENKEKKTDPFSSRAAHGS